MRYVASTRRISQQIPFFLSLTAGETWICGRFLLSGFQNG
jgi:hypothetical protein